MGEILIGTAGYSYMDWVGPVYPVGCRRSDMLALYAEEFYFVEVNYTYYRMPTARTLAQMASRTPPDFLFAVKAFQGMTHTRDLDAAGYRAFREALAPLTETGRLACILAQFPQSFHFNPANCSYLERVREGLNNLPLVFEFRSADWQRPETENLLHRMGVTLAAVDLPDLPGLPRPELKATSPLGYVRFHGRNRIKWYYHRESYERYDYLYSPEELSHWVPTMAAFASSNPRLCVSFNNHYGGQAVINARMLRNILRSYKKAAESGSLVVK